VSLLEATIQNPSIWGSVNALGRCKDLAKDGFYYVGPRDKVRCEFCNLEVYEWETKDRVHEEHMKFNSKCPLHSLGPSSTGNVRIGEEQTGEVSTDAVVFAEVATSSKI
jgi:Inhibitor of Apoptosis domain